MTPERFIACLDSLGWTRRNLAERLGLASPTTVRRWATGEASIPHALADWLERRATAMDTDPLPTGWAPRHSSAKSSSGKAG
jgi:transcriptional regulator with XRE-family HTH domain